MYANEHFLHTFFFSLLLAISLHVVSSFITVDVTQNMTLADEVNGFTHKMQ